jgi:thiamine pyrophosphate-dependent acetolactate synthase large subunit-like protein
MSMAAILWVKTSMNMTGASVIVDSLVRQQAKYVFLVPGRSVDPLVREIARDDRLMGIVTTSELGSGYMADGYARASGKLGVCLSTGGPGASNLVTAAINARLEASKVLFLTGDVPSDRQGQGYFHDSSTAGTRSVELFQQALSYSRAIAHPDDLLPRLERVISQLPAHLAIGSDIQTHCYPIATDLDFLSVARSREQVVVAAKSGAQLELRSQCGVTVVERDSSNNTADKAAAIGSIGATCNELLRLPWSIAAGEDLHWDETAVAIAPAPSLPQQLDRLLNERPNIVVLVGSRAIVDGRADALLDFVETYQLPVATTMSAKGAISEIHPLSLGTFGHGGNRRANQALVRDDIDTLLLIGLDFNQNESLEWDARLYSDCRQVIKLDRLPHHLPPTVKIDLEVIVDDCGRCLEALARKSHQELHNLRQTIPHRLNWLAQVRSIPWHWSISAQTSALDRSVPLDELIRTLQVKMPADAILCADAGTTRVFAGHSWISRDLSSCFTSSQLAPMGWAIAAGMGIQLAYPDRRTIVLTGDGSMLMSGLEIATAARYQLPVLFVICNNRGYGTIYQRFSTAVEMNDFTLLPEIDWLQFARSLGIAGRQVASAAELDLAIDEVLVDRRPFVLDVTTPLTHTIA